MVDLTVLRLKAGESRHNTADRRDAPMTHPLLLRPQGGICRAGVVNFALKLVALSLNGLEKMFESCAPSIQFFSISAAPRHDALLQIFECPLIENSL